MARTPNNKELNPTPDGFSETRLEEAGQAAQQLARLNAEANENAVALAGQLGYTGSLNRDVLEAGIEASQSRIDFELFAIGAQLILLKELCTHGEFAERCNRLGYEDRLVRRMMQATLKFGKRATSPVLGSLGKSKLFELVVLDNDEIQELTDGGSVRGITLDAVDRMSVKELRAALRERDLKIASKETQLAQKDSKLNELDDQLNLAKFGYKNRKPDEVADELRSNLTLQAFAAEAAVSGNLRGAIAGLVAHGTAHQTSHDDFIVGLLCQIETAISSLRGEFQLKAAPDGEDLPEWLRPEFDPLAAAYGKAN